jgi:importin subunit beta-1
LLATELAHTGKSMVARMAAGLQFKNRITSKDPEVKAQYQNMWLSFPQQDRNQIKQLILQALGTETTKATTAPQVYPPSSRDTC